VLFCPGGVVALEKISISDWLGLPVSPGDSHRLLAHISAPPLIPPSPLVLLAQTCRVTACCRDRRGAETRNKARRAHLRGSKVCLTVHLRNTSPPGPRRPPIAKLGQMTRKSRQSLILQGGCVPRFATIALRPCFFAVEIPPLFPRTSRGFRMAAPHHLHFHPTRW